MTGHDHHGDGPARAGRELAELADRLRRSVVEAPGAMAAAWAGRFAAAARCWRRVGRESDLDDFADLAAGLEAVAAALEAGGALQPDLTAALALADARLAALLQRYDDGLSAAALGVGSGWSLLAAAEAEAAPAPVPMDAAPAGPVALLVASPFLRGVLASRLDAAGRLTVSVADPALVPVLLAGPDAPVLILCDNEEPTNHLRRLRRLLGEGIGPPLVLVASGGGSDRVRARRALAVGADAVWPEPWRAEQLPAPAATGNG
ncbi:MAG: hypothetical protein R6X35_00425 [Candidatus Krumholzibacteriia bacterium]